VADSERSEPAGGEVEGGTAPSLAVPSDHGSGSASGGLAESVRKVFVAIVLLFVFIAALQLYFAVQTVVAIWFADEYVPILNAIFYLCVIAGGVSVIRICMRRRA